MTNQDDNTTPEPEQPNISNPDFQIDWSCGGEDPTTVDFMGRVDITINTPGRGKGDVFELRCFINDSDEAVLQIYRGGDRELQPMTIFRAKG